MSENQSLAPAKTGNDNEITIESRAFELLQRQAKMLASSTLVPKEFQGNMANCAIGLNIAKRLGADPFMVVQNIDIIHGRPAFRATFLIAMVNASGRFTPLQFRIEGAGDKRGCVAYAKNKETGETVEGPEVTMAMAKEEGWSTKAGSKWKTMPELMLRYRAAAFFSRIYASDITLGMQTTEEVMEVTREPRQVQGREVQSALFTLPDAQEAEPDTTQCSACAQFWALCEDAGLDDMDVMAYLKQQTLTEAEYPANLLEQEAAHAITVFGTIATTLTAKAQ